MITAADTRQVMDCRQDFWMPRALVELANSHTSVVVGIWKVEAQREMHDMDEGCKNDPGL